MKVCSKCGKELSLDNFHKNKGNKDGLSGACKGCANERAKAWQEANTERAKANGKKWCEANLEKRKTTSGAWYEKNSEWVIAASIIWRKAHPEKANAASKKWCDANPERVKARKREWCDANLERAKATSKIWHVANPEKTKQYIHRRRAAKRSLLSTLTVAQWEAIKQYFNNACCYCGEEKPLHQEHFLALSKGGEYTRNNIVPACKSCNSSKRDKTFFAWYPSHESYDKDREYKILKYLGYDKQNIQQLSIL